MQRNYTTITILRENGNRSYKIKKFPVFIGSLNGKNIIPLSGDGVDGRHGSFSLQKNNLCYEDTSKYGTKFLGKIYKNEKIVLTHGTNELHIGRFRVVIENNYSIDKSLEEKKRKGNKKYLMTLLIVSSFASLLLLLGFIYFTFLDKSPIIVLNDFDLSPDTLTYYKDITFSGVSIEGDNKADFNEVSGQLVFEKEGIKPDTIKFENFKTFQNHKIVLPPGLAKSDSNDGIINVKLQLISDDYEFKPSIIVKPFIISNRFQSQTEDGITLNTYIKGYFFTFDIADPNSLISSYKVDFGDRQNPFQSSELAPPGRSYSIEGNYDFVVVVTLKDKGKIEFRRKVIVD
ncbi:MAG: hypothetical protein IPJ03_01605 [Ignavibacteriales bacterium]|nr:hypothetical protein [Ignavibacteriales bacterium]